MALSDELQKLAELRRRGVLSESEFATTKTKVLATSGPRSLRRQSTVMLGNWPLWAIAISPDPERGEWRGHARGIFALGSIALGGAAAGCGGYRRWRGRPLCAGRRSLRRARHFGPTLRTGGAGVFRPPDFDSGADPAHRAAGRPLPIPLARRTLNNTVFIGLTFIRRTATSRLG